MAYKSGVGDSPMGMKQRPNARFAGKPPVAGKPAGFAPPGPRMGVMKSGPPKPTMRPMAGKPGTNRFAAVKKSAK